MGAKMVTFPAEFSEGQRAIIRQIAYEVRKANEDEDAARLVAAIQKHHDECGAPKIIERLKGAVTVWQIAAGVIFVLGAASTVYAVLRNLPCK